MRTPTLAACAAAVLFLAGTACNPPARHAALTLFFDGVPPPAAPAAAGGTVATASIAPVQHYREHGPYGAKLCSACHASPAAGNGFIVPRDQLCSHCHDLGPAKKVQHDPMASGECLSCHDPHSSTYRYLLLAAPNVVCAGCHEKEVLPEDAAHTDGTKQCIDCHDPHQSDKASLLR